MNEGEKGSRNTERVSECGREFGDCEWVREGGMKEHSVRAGREEGRVQVNLYTKEDPLL